MTLRGFSSWILSFISTSLLTCVILILLFNAMAISNALISSALIVLLINPIVWGLLMFYSYWDEVAWRPPAIMGLISVVGAVVVTLHWVQE